MVGNLKENIIGKLKEIRKPEPNRNLGGEPPPINIPIVAGLLPPIKPKDFQIPKAKNPKDKPPNIIPSNCFPCSTSMEHHSSKEAMEAAHRERESTMHGLHGAMHVDHHEPPPPTQVAAAAPSPPTATAPPSPSSTAAPPNTTAAAASSPSPSPIARAEEKTLTAAATSSSSLQIANFSSVNQPSSHALTAVPLSVMAPDQYSPSSVSSSTSSSQDEEDLRDKIEFEINSCASHGSNKEDKKDQPRTLVALAQKREREREQQEKNSDLDIFASKLNVRRKLNFDYLPNDLCSAASGSTQGKYIIPQLRTPQVMMIKEFEELEEENSTNPTKIAYIHGELQLILETNDKIETPHEIDIFSGKLNMVVDQANFQRKDKNKQLVGKDSSFRRYPCVDPGHFSLGVRIKNNNLVTSFLDAGSSYNYMSKTLYDKLGFPPITSIPLNQKFIGVVDNIDIKISDFIFQTTFMIFDVPLTKSKEIVLGRSFLSVSKAILNMHEGSVTLHLGTNVRKLFMAWNLTNHNCPIQPSASYLGDLKVIREE